MAEWIPVDMIPSRAVPGVGIPDAAAHPTTMAVRPARRVYVVSPTLVMGGAERMASVLAEGLRGRGYDTVLCDASQDGIPDVRDAWATIWWGRTFEGLQRPPRSLYVMHSPGGTVLSDLQACRDQVDRVIAVCGQCAHQAGQPARVVWNGLPLATEQRGYRQSPDESFVMGFLGRYMPEKGVLRAIEALALLPDHIRLRTYGSGLAREALLEAARRLGVADRVTLGGVVTDTRRILREIDALVLPSDYEGCPVAVVEAMLCGCPVVASPVGDVPQLLAEGRGVLAGTDPPSIAEAIRGLAEQPERTQTMAIEARRWAGRDLCLDRMLDAYEAELALAGPDLSAEVTCYVISSGEHSRAECLERLARQTVQVRVAEIKDVSPMSRAFAEMHATVETPLFVEVDADMLLAPGAVEALYEGIRSEGDRCAEYVGWLWGDIEQEPIQGVKIYRTEIARRYPYSDSMSCEWSPMSQAQADGFRVVCAERPTDEAGCLGVHASAQTAESARVRWHRLMGKWRRNPDRMAYFARFPRELLHRVGKSVDLAALEGALAGLAAPLPSDTERDASVEPPELRRIRWMLSRAVEGPQELALYLTSKCQHRCTWCRRTLAPDSCDAPDVTPKLAERALRTWPTITSVCLAGFGEPLLCEGLDEILAVLQKAGQWAQLITNGVLLDAWAVKLRERGIRNVAVSLNGPTPLAHERECGAPTWGRVMMGIRAAQDAGLYVALSMVVRQSTLEEVPAFLDLCASMGTSAHLHNLLHHGGPVEAFDAEVVSDGDRLDEIKAAHPGARVLTWPQPIGGPCPRKCQSPMVFVGLDGAGNLTPCRRVRPPSPLLGRLHANAWLTGPFARYRSAMWYDQPLPSDCERCFGAWKE